MTSSGDKITGEQDKQRLSEDQAHKMLGPVVAAPKQELLKTIIRTLRGVNKAEWRRDRDQLSADSRPPQREAGGRLLLPPFTFKRDP